MKTNTIFNSLIITVLLVWAVNIPGMAQPRLDKARAMKAEFRYMKAIELYAEYFKTATPGLAEKREMAECYIRISDVKNAEQWYAKIVSTDGHTAEDVLTWAGLLKSTGQYTAAMAQYTRYANMKPADASVAHQGVESCRQSLSWIGDPVYYDVFNEKVFNSPNSDFGLMSFGNGFVLTTDRKIPGKSYTQDEIYGWTGNPYLQLVYFSENPASKPGVMPRLMEDINNSYHNGPGSFNESSGLMYFTRTKLVRITKKPVNSDPTSWYDKTLAIEYTIRLEIFSALYSGGTWKDIKPFAFNKAEEYSVGHPALSPDGNVLYFVSDMPGGFGATDIWYSERQTDGNWGTPVNAGQGINTPGKEVFPVIDSDGVLYFSSDGWLGMGGLDLFSSKGSRSTWEKPENLKYPFNSPRDDFSIIFTENGKSGYFASNREGGLGEDDIYGFIPAPPTNLVVAVITREKLDDNRIVPLADVNIDIRSTGQQQPNPVAGPEGTWFVKADCGSTYTISGTKDGYFARNASVDAICKTRNDTVFVEMVFDKIVIDKPIVLENIYYDFDKWNIRSDAATELDKLVTILVNNPGISIELGSHTDARGSDDYNRVLSQKRAESAVNYIISRGIDANRITAKGYGESVPVNSCINGVNCPEEEHQKNRRTEFRVTRVDNNIRIITK